MSKRAEEAALKAYPAYDGASEQWKKAHLSSLSEYIQGYEQAEKDLGWHSVEECLPEIDEEVIVLTNRVRDIELPSANRLCFAHIVDKDYAMDWDGWNIPGVKFWMPMPKIPSEK